MEQWLIMNDVKDIRRIREKMPSLKNLITGGDFNLDIGSIAHLIQVDVLNNLSNVQNQVWMECCHYYEAMQ